jgi:hypothetical protein
MRSLDGFGGLRLCAKVKATYPCRSCRWTHAHAQARTVEAWGGVQQQCVWVVVAVVAVVGERKASLNKEETVVGVQGEEHETMENESESANRIAAAASFDHRLPRRGTTSSCVRLRCL